MDQYPGRKGRTAIAVKKGIPHDHIELPALVSVEATGVCITVGNVVVLLAAGYKSPDPPWNNTDIHKPVGFNDKTILAGDLNAKHPFWNSSVPNPSGAKLLELFHKNEFEISAPQCPTHYSPAGNGDILDIVVHQNIRLSSVIVSNILDSDYLPILCHILDHVKIRNLSETTEKFTDWERFQSLASYLISHRLEINTGVEADKAAREFTASIPSAYRLSTSFFFNPILFILFSKLYVTYTVTCRRELSSASKVKNSEVNPEFPGLDQLLKQIQRRRKLWQETRDPACKTSVNWVTNAIIWMTRRRAIERWETKIENTEITP
jgi:hypothetical protein